MQIDPGIWVAGISLIASAVGAGFAYKSSKNANNVENRKVDQTAYDRAINYYEKQLDRVNAQLDRVTAQLDRVSAQLAAEQEVSSTLRAQVRTLQNQVEMLKDTINNLRHNSPADKRETAEETEPGFKEVR